MRIKENFFIHCESYRGGMNNLWVAQDSVTGVVATSTIGKVAVVTALKRKLTRQRKQVCQ